MTLQRTIWVDYDHVITVEFLRSELLRSLYNAFCTFFVVNSTPKTPIELAIDFILHDFEMAGRSALFRFSFQL